MFIVAIVTPVLSANLVNPNQEDKLIQDTRVRVRGVVNPIIRKYCGDSCQIIDIIVKLEEEVSDTGDLGFEEISGSQLKRILFVDNIDIEIQIDSKVSQNSRQRLKQIIMNHTRQYSGKVNVSWTQVEFPDISSSLSGDAKMKEEIENKVKSGLHKIIERYCPGRCLVNHILIFGKTVTYDQSLKLEPLDVYNSKILRSHFFIEEINVAVLLDSTFSEKERQNIVNIMRASTSFLNKINFDIQTTEFPEPFVKRQERLDSESEDPYGLEKLRRTLTLFRELAGTKEIISSESKGETSGLTWFLYILAILVVSAGAGFIILKYANAKQDSNFLMKHLSGVEDVPAGGGGKKAENVQGKYGAGDVNQRLEVASLKEDLANIFVNAPKVSKETFTRLIQTEGVEHVAKYVHIFGKVIIFELLDNPNMQRSLFELSEYYHKSEFNFSLDEELEILKTLKSHVTASEIKVMTEKTMDHFDFLRKLNTNQIFDLIREENSQVKGVIITQLSPKNRKLVFSMYSADDRVGLMKELCHGDSLPKEYLINIAKSLHKKVLSRPEFDTQNLRSNEVVLELIEKASLEEQRSLMKKLAESNPDAARSIKMRLVTIDMLPYLKDGQLLELVLGMEREDLLIFLMGTKPNIRDLLLSHAPRELADSWLEDMESVSHVEEENYRVVENSFLTKIRNYGAEGSINIHDINEIIFAEENVKKPQGEPEEAFDKEKIVA